MSILALDKNTAKYLRTSQVITSVSYTVKELVENSLDANAKNIEVNLFDNGLAHIEVKDDGFGISKEDAKFMALQSYTSKIKDFEDLNKLSTYGFRGEALQALAQVSELTIITRSKNEDIATSYSIDTKGNIANCEPCHRSIGTTVQVKGIFKNMPVRRQGLLNTRRANQDLKYMENLLKCFGIIQPSLRITYRRNKQIVFIKSSVNSLTESIANVLGKDIASNLEWIEKNSPEGTIQLMLPKKDLLDPTLLVQSGHQFVFINNKILEHKELVKLLNKRIQEYYASKQLAISNKNLFFLNLIIDPSNLDVNLEPNKTKGFLKNEKALMEFLDNILIKFYQLEDISEKVNRLNETDIMDESLNEKNESWASLVDNEKEWPACKKRKIDCNRKSPVENVKDCYSEKKRPAERDFSKNPPMENIKELVLSESDSHSDSESGNFEKRRSVKSRRSKESIRQSTKFNSRMEVKNEFENNQNDQTDLSSADTETLSQLPVVDLGEEFTQIFKDKSSKGLPDTTSISKTNDDVDSLLSDIDLLDDFNSNEEIQETKSVLKQSTLMLNTSTNGEIILEVDKNNTLNQDPFPPSLNSWSRGHVSGLKPGVDVTFLDSSEKEQNSNSLSGFDIFFSQTRTQVVEENPELSVLQIANLLSNRWKEMSSDKKAFYQDIAKQRAKLEELQAKKAKKEKGESEKNKKRLINMLKNMKEKKNVKRADDTLRARTIVNMETNIENVSKKFYRKKSYKRNVAVGPLKNSLWIVKVGSQYCLLNTPEMFRGLNFTEHSPSETNAETVENLLKQWMLEKDDMSILHIISQNS